MKAIPFSLLLLVFSQCHPPTLKQSINNYKTYFGKHETELSSIATYIITNYTDTIFNKINLTEVKQVLKKELSSNKVDVVLNDLQQIDYYNYGDSLKTVRIFINISHTKCTSVSFFKKIKKNNPSCKPTTDSLYLGDCWYIFVINQNPCYDPF